MLHRRLTWMVLLACCSVRAGAYAQSVEEDDAEAIQAPRPMQQGQREADLAEVEEIIVRRTNKLREEEGHTAVEVNPELTAAARYFAGYMARTNKYGHTADGKRPWDRAKEHGYDACIVTENIAYQYSSAGFTADRLGKAFFEGWKESPGHRKNMLDADVTQTGVAVVRSSNSGYYYAVQMFGRPASQRIEFQVVNRLEAEVSYEIAGRMYSLPPRHTRTHQRCRPAELTLQSPQDAEAPREQESKAVQPQSGDRYAVVRGASGDLALEREQASGGQRTR